MKYVVLGSFVAATAFTLAMENDARACGGCFTPTENPTVVTDHRMIFSVSKDQSTLYDQIQYTGSPSSFGWVLPFVGDIQVGVSSDQLFGALDQVTQTQIVAPPLNCPQRPNNCNNNFSDAVFAPTGEEGAGGSVNVLKHEVVGPYETVQLQATNPTALEDWLSSHSYNIPDDVKPTIAAYQSEHFNFLAVKLVPGQGVQNMQPIRVTTKGSNVALPLRMIAAGAGATVGITLWLVAEGRYQPGNFDFFQINETDLSWDWIQNKSNYIDLRATKSASGKSWEVESATMTLPSTLQANLGYSGADAETFGGYSPEKDAQGNVTKAATVVQQDDFAVLFNGIAAGSEHVTRMRVDLTHAALNQDLTVRAADDQALLSNVRQVTKELNEPQCPVYNGCDQEGTAPRSQAVAKTDNNNNSGCRTSSRGSSNWLVIGLAFVALALGRKARR